MALFFCRGECWWLPYFLPDPFLFFSYPSCSLCPTSSSSCPLLPSPGPNQTTHQCCKKAFFTRTQHIVRGFFLSSWCCHYPGPFSGQSGMTHFTHTTPLNSCEYIWVAWLEFLQYNYLNALQLYATKWLDLQDFIPFLLKRNITIWIFQHNIWTFITFITIIVTEDVIYIAQHWFGQSRCFKLLPKHRIHEKGIVWHFG